MFLKLLFTIVILNLSAIFCQEEVKSSIDIFDEIILSGLDDLYFQPGIYKSVPFIFIMKDDNDEKISYLKRIIRKSAQENKIAVSFAESKNNAFTDTAYNIVEVDIRRLQTEYSGFSRNRFLGEKFIRRNIYADIGLAITTMPGDETFSTSIKRTITDEVDFEKLTQAESGQYKFLKARHPEIGTFEGVIFPALLIAASAAAIIMFFFVRTK